jgi:hypothetical protein
VLHRVRLMNELHQAPARHHPRRRRDDDAKDGYTHRHSERVALLSSTLLAPSG